MRAKRRARARAKARTGMADLLTIAKDHRAAAQTVKLDTAQRSRMRSPNRSFTTV
jgi:hypothetical protein